MELTKLTECVTKCEKAITEKLAKTQEALRLGKKPEFNENLESLSKEVDDYNSAAQKVVFCECLATEKPFVTFANKFFYTGKKVDVKRDQKTNAVMSVSIVEKTPRLSLDKFVRDGDLDKTILNDITKLLDVLYIRMNNIVKLSSSDLAKKSIFFCDVVKKKEAGETPDSNTQLTKMLNAVLAKMGIEAKTTNRDLLWIQQNSFNFDPKSKCSYKAVNDHKFCTILCDVANHFTEGTEYSVLERKVKE